MHVARLDRVIAAALAALALLSAVRADAQTQKKLAVLQFGVSKLSTKDRALLGDRLYFSERVRSLVLESRPPVALITQDEMGQIMAANAEAAANCEEGQCVRQGELLGADLLIAGEFTRVGRSLILVMKLISLELTADRKRIERQLASSQARGKEPDELIDALTPTMQTLLAPLLATTKNGQLPGRSTAPVEAGRVGGLGKDVDLSGGTSTVIVWFETTPVGSLVVLDGEPLCQTPCSKEVPLGRHQVKFGKDGYETATQTLEAKKGAKVSAKLLRSVALVAVETTPSGLAVSIDGTPVGKSPVAARELAPGGHEVVVEDPCWVREGEKIAVQKGEEKTLRIAPKPRMAGIKVSARTKDGNDVEGTAEVDGVAVGAVPGSFKVALCSRRVEVRGGEGAVGKGELTLQEGQVVPVAVTLSGGTQKVGRTGRQPLYQWTDKDGQTHVDESPPSEAELRAAGRPLLKDAGHGSAGGRRSSAHDWWEEPTDGPPDEIDKAAKLYNMPAELIRSVVAVVAGGTSTLSGKRVGLMALPVEQIEAMFVTDPQDPRQSIQGGTRYLRTLANRYNGDLFLVLAAYSAGEESVKKFGGVPPDKNARDFIRRVLAKFNQYKLESARRAAGAKAK